jgi:arabinan endo-1,5-alpha-L-arabinosidase
MVMGVTANNAGSITVSAETSDSTDSSVTVLTDEEVAELTANSSYTRTSVHDPSIVYDNEGTYYVFGSHMGVSKTTDLMNWTAVYSETTDSKLFGMLEEVTEGDSDTETNETEADTTTEVSILNESGDVENASNIASNESSEEDVTEDTSTVDVSADEEVTEDTATEETSDDSKEGTSKEEDNSSTASVASSESSDAASDDASTEASDAADGDAASDEIIELDTLDADSTETVETEIVQASYNEAFKVNTVKEVTALVNGEETTVSFMTQDNESFDITEWISDNTVQGNMWAPDVIYNEDMNKWCMYLSLNGATWNSAIILLTADDIEGPYVYNGPVVFSGFSLADSSKSFHDTDLEIVIGEQDELPVKYQQLTTNGTSWGTYWPHAIDPAVFYDEEGKLWMTYGSWSGGIYVLELDEETGLRDYTVTYDSNYDELGARVTSDEYFGKKIAGGYYVSGEGSYIEHIGDYYYLFISYGFYSPEGGYNMRVFRSKSPDGPYTDENGTSAIFDSYIMNYSATDTTNNRGMKLMGGYQWDSMELGEIAQGHNSAITTEDGKSFVIYHTKFNDGTASHEVRVHQLFTNEKGWLVTAPYEYSGETLSDTGYSADEVTGTYGIIFHEFQTAYSKLECQTPVDVTFNSDGTISGEYSGTWKMTDGTPYCQITIDGSTYYGVFTKQILDGTNVEIMCFTAMDDDGLSLWGSGEISDSAAVAITASNSAYGVASTVYSDITLPTTGDYDTTITWTSSNEAVLSAAGTVNAQDEDTVVTLTATISKGSFSYSKSYSVTVRKLNQNSTESLTLAEYFTDEWIDLSTTTASYTSPFYKGAVEGLDLSGGVTMEFDCKANGTVNVLGTILAITGNGGKLYFTPGSYLGYNDGTYYYDANLNNYSLVEDYIGSDEAHVAINLTQTGFTVSVDGEVAYTEEIIDTDNGAATLEDYSRVLRWLYKRGTTLSFGTGSWWTDTANVEISNVKFIVGPTTEWLTEDTIEDATDTESDVVTYDGLSYTKDSVELTSTSYQEVEENPFYGKNLSNLELRYTINMTDGTAQNGWDGIFAFYNSSTTGRVSIQTAPYVCYNDANGNWMDINQPGVTGGTNVAPDMTPGTEYQVDIKITTTDLTISVDGEEIATGTNGSGADYSDLLAFISECDQLTWGVGTAASSYWNTEMCTLTDISFDSYSVLLEEDEVDLTSADQQTVIDNPFYGASISNIDMSYTINMTDGTAQNGWDGIFAFYNSSTTGRVSVQTAPYVCYNDANGNWIDINQPGVTGGTDVAPDMTPGTDYKVNISITEDDITVTVDGEEIAIGTNGSGATYADLLSYITECDQFTWGVGKAASSYWNTEMCTLKDIKISSQSTSKNTDADDSEDTDETEDSTETSTNEADITNETVSTENGIVKYTVDSVVLDNTGDISIIENPLYNVESDKITIDYTVNMTDGTAQNGWDGLFAFYNTVVETDTLGRVSVQSAPYICYNDWSGNYLDINKPDLDGAVNMAPSMTAGTEHTVSIVLTADALTIAVDGEELDYPVDGTGTYEGMMDYIESCDKFTWGVGTATSSFWNTELCTITDVTITGGKETEDSSTTESSSAAEDSSATESSTTDTTQTVDTTDTTETVENVAVTKVKLNKSKKTIRVGQTYQLKATVSPTNATNQNVTWKSSNKKVATVDANGLVTAKKKGTAVITVTTEDGSYTAQCKITVKKAISVTSVKLNKSKKTLKVGKTVTLKAKVKPTNATNKNVTWKSSNKKVATVDSNGKVTALKKGTTTITVITKDGKYKAKCKITVK